MEHSTPAYTRAIKDLASDDRPREKALAHGFSSLTSAELLALLVGSGTRGESVVDLCQRIINGCSGKLYNLARLSIADLTKQYRGIGKAKAITILAALELSRRYHSENFEELPQVRDSLTAFQYIIHHTNLCDILHEEFWLITLNRAKRISGAFCISKGGTSSTIVDNKILLKTAIDHLADAIILVHNHPSGTCRPSAEDNRLTDRLRDACKIIGIEMVDHIIIAGKSYYSYIDHGM